MRTINLDDNSTQEERNELFNNLEKEIKNNTFHTSRFVIDAQYLYRILKYCSTQDIGDIAGTFRDMAEALKSIPEGKVVHVLADEDKSQGEKIGNNIKSITMPTSPEMFVRMLFFVKQAVTSKDDMKDVL